MGGGDADELEVAEELVVLDQLTLTLVDLDLDGSLEVGGSREYLGLLGGDSGVTVDQTGEDTTQGLDTERQGSDIEQQDISDLTSQDGTLDGGTDDDSLIGVDTFRGLLVEVLLEELLDLGDTGRTTDKDNLEK